MSREVERSWRGCTAWELGVRVRVRVRVTVTVRWEKEG